MDKISAVNWLEISKTPEESDLKFLQCMLEGYSVEDWIKFGEMYVPLNKPKKEQNAIVKWIDKHFPNAAEYPITDMIQLKEENDSIPK